MRPFFFAFALICLAHSFHLLGMPNGAEGSNWLGYTRSRFLLAALSGLSGLALLWVLRTKHKFLESPRFEFATRYAHILLPILGLLITFCVQILAWPEVRLSAAFLSIRENFGHTLFWAIPGLLVGGLAALHKRPSGGDFIRRVTLALFFLVYVNLRLLTAMSFRYVSVRGDAVDYIGFANFADMAASGGLWALTRPFLLPLIGTLLHQDEIAFAWLQTVISIGAWGILAYVVSKRIKNNVLRLFAFAAVLLFSAQQRVLVWDWSILSESLTFSLLALMMACWLLLLEKPSWPRLAVLLLLSFLWAFVRDLHAWVLLCTGLLSLAGIFVFRARKLLIATSVSLLLLFLASNHSVNATGLSRWVIPYMHVLIFDIWPDPQAMAFYQSRGLTAPEELLARRDVSIEDFYGYTFAPEFSDFRQWLLQRGQATLAAYLLDSMPESLLLPLNPANGYPIEAQTLVGRFWDYQPLLPDFLENALTSSLRGFGGLLLLLCLAAFGMYALIRSKEPIWSVPLAGILLSYPYAFLSWHGDAFERTRHVLPADILLRLSLLLLLLFAVDGLLLRLPAKHQA